MTSHASIPFDERYVAYLDILGWKEASRNCTSDVQEAIRQIHEPTSWFTGDCQALKGFEDFQYAAFSDNLVLSAPKGSGEVVLYTVALLARTLLASGFLTRGGLSYAKVFHNKNAIFGPGIISAVELECAAKYPRIIFDAQVIDVLSQEIPLLTHSGRMLKDMLGTHVLNLTYAEAERFPESRGEDDTIEKRFRDILPINEIELSIRNGLASTGTKPARREKWWYMRTMFDQMVRDSIVILEQRALRDS